jgi:hypothetical protein
MIQRIWFYGYCSKKGARMKIQINIPSISRFIPSGEYIHKTIKYLRKSGYTINNKINIFVGDSNSGYVSGLQFDPIVKVHFSLAYPKANWKKSKKANWNFLRCLNYIEEDTDYLLILEDDVRVAIGWQEHLQKCIEQAKSKHADNFILSLYYGHSQTNDLLNRYNIGELLWKGNEATFAMSQGVLYPVSVAKKYYVYLFNNGYIGHGDDCNYDRHLALFMVNNMKVKLYYTCPCLVQHIADVGTGIGGEQHRTKSFMPRLP